jgi:hypothetical protein
MEEVVKTVVRIGLATRCCNGPGSGWLGLCWSWVVSLMNRILSYRYYPVSYSGNIFLCHKKVKRQKYSSTINNWILSGSFEMERILMVDLRLTNAFKVFFNILTFYITLITFLLSNTSSLS